MASQPSKNLLVFARNNPKRNSTLLNRPRKNLINLARQQSLPVDVPKSLTPDASLKKPATLISRQQSLAVDLHKDLQVETPKETPTGLNLDSRRPYKSKTPKQRSFLNMFDESWMGTHIKATTDPDKTLNTKGEVQIGHYLFQKELGRGGFGTVYLALDVDLNIQVAIKVFKKRYLKKRFVGRGKNGLTSVMGEIQILMKLDHPNIIKILEVIETSSKIYLVLEYASKGPISELLPLSEEKAAYYFSQLISALEYMHENKLIVHRDIKPDNLLIDENDCLKIWDFGSAHTIYQETDETHQLAGTYAFMPPELYAKQRGSVHAKPIEMWSVGVTLFYMMIGRIPFTGRKIADLTIAIQNEELEVPQDLSLDMIDLLHKLIDKNPRNRINLVQLKSHPWLCRHNTIRL